MRNAHRITALFLALAYSAVFSSAAHATTSAKYILVFHGDGMGPEHIKAGGMFVHGAAGTLSFESFPRQTTMTHNNASNGTTDSAASATAMATGVKVNNGVISVRLPGDGVDLPSVLERQQALGKSTGLVTESHMTDASPAGHGAHSADRYNATEINSDYLTQTRPQVLFGGGGNGFDTGMASAQGYAVLTDRSALLALDAEAQTRVAGSFGTGLIPPDGLAGRNANLPTLPEMTQKALAILDNDPDGFYGFFEHEGIDEYSHANQAQGLVLSMKEFDAAVQAAVAWVDDPATPADWTNTLLVVLADHETGGLTATETLPQAGVVPAVSWSTTGHTQTPVRVFARGAGADQITGSAIENIAICAILSPAAAVSPTPSPDATAIAGQILDDFSRTGHAAYAYPNPGKDRIQINVRLARSQAVKIILRNPAGERAAVLQDQLPAGTGKLVWDCRAAAPGLYLASVQLDGQPAELLKIYVIR